MKIITYPNPILNQKCNSVLKEDYVWIKNMVEPMFKLMIQNNGCGLAGPQIGLLYDMFIMISCHGPILITNPQITHKSSVEETIEEGCLSIPNFKKAVSRPTNIFASYFDHSGCEKDLYLQGMDARIFMHEYDHLQGKLII